MAVIKAITTPAEVAAFVVPEGRQKARRAVRSKHGAGLALEVRAGKTFKLWMYRFNLGGRQHEMMLGSFPAMTLKRAREEHGAAVELVKKGLDPRKQRAAEKATNLAAWTMQDAFDRWIEHYQKEPGRNRQPPTAKTVAQQRGRWRLHLAPRLADFYVRDVTRRLVIDVLEQASSKAREEARLSLSLLRQLLRYCQQREQIEVNPTDGLTPGDIAASAAAPRNRHLSLIELRQLWQAIDDARADTDGKAATAVFSIPMANALKLLILTGARRGEVAYMRWDEIKKDVWTIPAERAKSRRQHQVHLCPLALDLLEEQRQLDAGDHVFTSTQGTGRAIHPDSLSSAVTRLQGRASKRHDETAPLYGLLHFTTHDLRRTFATQATETLMADPLLVEQMLAHAPPKLMATYNRATRWKPQVEVWKRWGETVASMIAQDPGSNVVPMRGGVA